jgi:hypothetical protein
LFDGVNRANFRAGAAIDTGIGVNDVDVTPGRNGGDGAFTLTRSAADALVVDFVGHDLLPPYYWVGFSILPCLEKKARVIFFSPTAI